MARWITVRKAFDYHWPGRSAVTAFRQAGDQFVKDEVADFAVERGYATEGKVDGSARSRKGKQGKQGRRLPKEPPAAETAGPGTVPPVDNEGAADADRAIARPPVDSDAG